MRPLNEREKRTIRIAGIGIVIYLGLYLGFELWSRGSRARTEYRRLVAEARTLDQRLDVYREKALTAQALMEQFQMDPAGLSRTTIVAEATAAIHKAALGGGIQLGPIRESPARAAARELAAVQLEGVGPVPGVLGFLQRVGSLGYPLIADSVQLTPERQPGRLKMNVTIVILDFDQWKARKGPDA